MLETAALAEEIADECHLNDKTLEKICNAYLPVQESYKMHMVTAPEITNDLRRIVYSEVISVMKKYRHDPDIFKAGKQTLSYPKIKKLIIESAKTDPYWKEALSFIDNPPIKALAKRAAHSPSPRN